MTVSFVGAIVSINVISCIIFELAVLMVKHVGFHHRKDGGRLEINNDIAGSSRKS
jgi:hypothetical protein